MIFPFRDENPTRRVPFITVALIALNLAVFGYQIALRWIYPDLLTPGVTLSGETALLPRGAETVFVTSLGMIPYEWTHLTSLKPTLYLVEDHLVALGPGQSLPVGNPLSAGATTHVFETLPFTRVPSILTLLTCMFVHGGWLHILGNMLFLWIFGDNVEDRLGHFRYLLFYLGCGVAGTLGHLIVSFNSTLPLVGASGAIAGIMGAYLYLFPHARVMCVWWLCFFVRVIPVSAGFVLGFWILLQILNGWISLGSTTGGVAFMAHIVGFGTGYYVVRRWFRKKRMRVTYTR